ncbi:MAG: hypothetical protein ACJAWD_000333 [Methylophilaceae bacterium]|jgi:hypothetical protein
MFINCEDGDYLIVEASVADNSPFQWWINGFGKSVQVI